MNWELMLADWLDEVATFGSPRRIQDSETATHLAQLCRYRYLIKLAVTRDPHAPASVLLQALSSELITQVSPSPEGKRRAIEQPAMSPEVKRRC